MSICADVRQQLYCYYLWLRIMQFQSYIDNFQYVVTFPSVSKRDSCADPMLKKSRRMGFDTVLLFLKLVYHLCYIKTLSLLTKFSKQHFKIKIISRRDLLSIFWISQNL